MHYCAVRDFTNEACFTADIISDIMNQEEKVNQAKRVWTVDITYRGRSENTLTWRRAIQRCISWWYVRYFSSLWYQVGQCYLLRTIHMLYRVIFLHFGFITCKQIRLQLSPIEIQNKMEQQTPIPPNQRWSRAKGKNTPFSLPWFGRGEGGLGFPFVLSKIVDTVWHEIFAGVYFWGLAIFCVLRELIFGIRTDWFF